MRAALLIRSKSWKSTTFWIRLGRARVSRVTPVRLGLCRLPNSSFFLLPSYFSPPPRQRQSNGTAECPSSLRYSARPPGCLRLADLSSVHLPFALCSVLLSYSV